MSPIRELQPHNRPCELWLESTVYECGLQLYNCTECTRPPSFLRDVVHMYLDSGTQPLADVALVSLVSFFYGPVQETKPQTSVNVLFLPATLTSNLKCF